MNPPTSEATPRRLEPNASPARDPELRAAHELGAALGSRGTPSERLSRALGVLAKRLGIARSVLYSVSPRDRKLEIVAWYGLDPKRYRARFGVGVAGRAALSRQQIVVPEVRLDPMALSELSDPDDWCHDPWSLVALPLLAGGTMTGVLSCYASSFEARDGATSRLVPLAAALASALDSPHERDAGLPESSDGPASKHRRRDSPFEYANMVGGSPAMRQIYEEVAQVARTSATTLIRGESGTGKELVACAIHNNSDRAACPLVKVNCAALPETLFESELFGHERGAYTGAHARRRGRFELAENGTLFLDEIGELSPAMQAKLLRVLQSREYERVGGSETLRTDARVIAATNRNLEERVRSGAFRQDLYYRLNVFSITVPPLRGRRGDIWALAEYFVGKYVSLHQKSVTRISNQALDLLSEYSWPGNVRELENAVERAIVVCDGFVIRPEHLPSALRVPEPSTAPRKHTLREAVAALESRMLAEALRCAGGNCARAARELGITERVVRYKASLYGIDVQSLRGRT